jgi:hypothetical protein
MYLSIRWRTVKQNPEWTEMVASSNRKGIPEYQKNLPPTSYALSTY